MSLNAWALFTLVVGLMSVIAYYKHSRGLGCFVFFGLPIIVLALVGWPYDNDFIDTSYVSVAYWMGLGFVGTAIGTTAVVLRIIR